MVAELSFLREFLSPIVYYLLLSHNAEHQTDHVTNATVYTMTNTKPLVERVRSRQLKLLGHILRMPDDEPIRLYALYAPQHEEKKPGRQSTSFLTYSALARG